MPFKHSKVNEQAGNWKYGWKPQKACLPETLDCGKTRNTTIHEENCLLRKWKTLGAITFDFSFTSLRFTVADLMVSSVLFMALINRTDVTITATFYGVFDIENAFLTNSPSEKSCQRDSTWRRRSVHAIHLWKIFFKKRWIGDMCKKGGSLIRFQWNLFSFFD